MWRREVRLTAEQREQLIWMVRHDPKPYRRERAAAILQVADGQAAFAVARGGLLVRRAPDTVYGWLDRFAERGVAGLTIAAGRGRKPAAFPPAAE
jgi:transposase